MAAPATIVAGHSKGILPCLTMLPLSTLLDLPNSRAPFQIAPLVSPTI